MTENNANDTDQNQATEDNDVLPDWAREKLTKANNEAAKYRNEKNDAVEAAKAEVTESFQGKVQGLETQLSEQGDEVSTSRLEVEKLKATIEAGVTADKALSFAELLKGEDADELKSHAEELKGLFGSGEGETTPPRATDPSQGQSGDPVPLNGDPLLDAVTRIVGKPRRR